MARLDKEHSGVMADEGKRIRDRRSALGMSQEDLAREAGVNRDTVGAIENGLGFRRSSLTKIEEALSRIEKEAGMDAPAVSGAEGSDLIEFDVTGDFGVHVVVKGPVRDAELLQRQVIGIIREIRRAEKEDDTPEQ